VRVYRPVFAWGSGLAGAFTARELISTAAISGTYRLTPRDNLCLWIAQRRPSDIHLVEFTTTASNSASTSTVARAIVRAGTCLDGDNCPRYHCRACGGYWLGNIEHTCGSAAPLRGSASSHEQLEEIILRWMQLELTKDDDLTTCALNVLERVKAAALGEAFLDTYGPQTIEDLWRDRDNHEAGHDRRQANGVAQTSADPSPTSPLGASHDRSLITQPATRNNRITVAAQEHQVARARADVAVRHEHHAAMPGPRRVDVEQLATETALLESLFQIDGGRWARLGDLNKDQCKALQLQHEAAADAFRQLADGLAEGQTVRQRWTAEQLAGAIGDTLREAASVRPTRY
jgi:hypothetical protein